MLLSLFAAALRQRRYHRGEARVGMRGRGREVSQLNRTSERSGEQTPFKPLRVLVMEDNAIIGMLFADLLAEMGHVVCAIVTTQEEGVAAAARFKPELMIVDASLSEGDGLSAVDEIVRDGFIPHVFVSGDTALVLATKPGAIVLRKPFRDRDLAKVIQFALSKTGSS